MNEKSYFNRGKAIFLILIGILVLLMFPYFLKKMFTDNLIKQWESELIKNEKETEWLRDTPTDTTSNVGMHKIVWRWSDFDGKMHKISFEINKQKLSEIPSFRERQGNRDLGALYRNLNEKCTPIMKPMIEAFKIEIKKQKYEPRNAYLKAMELVATAVQYIPYTLVLDNTGDCPCEMPFGSYSGECKVRSDGKGCCSGVMPLGVYAPAEFMYRKLGDCDTRSLFAYTILKELGFDVAVMVSEERGHSVLGVHLKNKNLPNYGRDYHNKKYYLWELTARDFHLGYNVEGDDWMSYLN